MTLATRVVGDGPAVVWLHGYTLDSSTWSGLWALLPGFRHVGVDLPGHGRSAPPDPGTTLPEVAAGVAAVVRAHSATRLVALSFGTMLALQVVLDEPDLVERLVLAAPALGGGATEPGADDRYVELMRLYRSGASAAVLADTWMQSPPDIFRGTEFRPVLRFALRQVILRHRWTELGTGSIGTMARYAHSPADLARVRARLQVLVGDQDMPVTQAVSAQLATTVPDVRLDVLAGAGHLCLLEEPKTAARLIRDHLEG